MQPEPTYCHDCDHALRGGKSDPPWRWLCIKHKRLDGFGFVTPTSWDGAPPYLYCKDVNGGACPLHQQVAPGQMTMGEMVEEIG